MHKKIFLLSVFILGLVFLLAKQEVAVNETIKLGTFTPPPSPTPPSAEPIPIPSPELPSVGCTLPPYYGYIDQYGDPFPLAFSALKRKYLKDNPGASEKEAETWACQEVWKSRNAAEEIFVAFGMDPETYHQYLCHWAKGMARCSAHLGYSVDELKDMLISMGYETSREFLKNYIISPLYLYPTSPSKIKIKVSGEVVSSQPKMDNNSWEVLAFPDGRIVNLSDQKDYQHLALDLKISNLKPPQEGISTSRLKLETTLRWYANQFGLNQREEQDFVDHWQKKLPIANFYLVSHFSEAETNELLAWEVSPKPDTEIKLMMYFRPLVEIPKDKILPPAFPQIPKRRGLTVFDFNGIIDW